MVKELVLFSGANLKLHLASFQESKALLQSLMEEGKTVKIDSEAHPIEVFKNAFFSGFVSKKVELALAACIKRALYNDLPITEATFEKEEARQDYLQVCFEVASENIRPFTKGLYAKYSHLLESLKVILAQGPQNPTC